jgi:hypothetical protein
MAGLRVDRCVGDMVFRPGPLIVSLHLWGSCVYTGMLRYAFRADVKFGPMLLLHFATAVLASCSNCEQRQVLSQAISPDGAWVATIYNSVCSDGVFVTTITDTVEMTRPNDPATPMPAAGRTVFSMDDHPYGVPKPLAARWTAQRSLEVTIPNYALLGIHLVGKQEGAFADITISYKFIPDDPAERACLKKWYSQPTDEQVRRMLSPNENLKVFVAKCRAEGGPHEVTGQ